MENTNKYINWIVEIEWETFKVNFLNFLWRIREKESIVLCFSTHIKTNANEIDLTEHLSNINMQIVIDSKNIWRIL